MASKSTFAQGSLFAGPNSKFAGVQIGAITYSFRSLPGSIEETLKYCVDSGVSAIELMGEAVEDYIGKPKNPVSMPRWQPGQPRPTMTDEQKAAIAQYNKDVATWRESVGMDKAKEVKKMFDKAGVSIYAFKPNALNPNNTDGEIEYALKVAKALGANSVTIELPTNPAHSQRLGDLASKHKVYIGYHAHLQATDTAWDVALAQSPYNSMNLDCGHYIAAGGPNTTASLLKLIENKHDRITSMHIKDRKNKENGGQNMPWGQGNTPLKLVGANVLPGSNLTNLGSTSETFNNVYATSYFGNGANLSGLNATNVATTATSANANFFVPFVALATTGNQSLGIDAGLAYNPSTNAMTAGINGGTF
jgi:sugar phosphate isomerase/epimerase